MGAHADNDGRSLRALQANKVDICHFDEEDSTWNTISVSTNGNALTAHKNHGDFVCGENSLECNSSLGCVCVDGYEFEGEDGCIESTPAPTPEPPTGFCFCGPYGTCVLKTGVYVCQCDNDGSFPTDGECVDPGIWSRTIYVKNGESIQKALNGVGPGGTVSISDGHYFEDLVTVRDGEKDNRITITGSKNTVIHGSGKEGRVFQIHHDYITLDGFTMDGQHGDGKSKEDYIDTLIYVHGNRKRRTIRENGKEYRSAIDGLIISNMVLQNAGGDCSRMSYFVTNAEYYANHVGNCGVHNFVFGGMKSTNGQVLEIGTPPMDLGVNPTPEDGSRYIHVHHNVFECYGNGLLLNEGTEYAVVEYNECTEQLDPNSGCLDSRTDNVVFRYNTVFENRGYGVRIGEFIDDRDFSAKVVINNEVYGNTFYGNYGDALGLQGHNGVFCENKCKGGCRVYVLNNIDSEDYPDVEGQCGNLMDVYWIGNN